MPRLRFALWLAGCLLAPALAAAQAPGFVPAEAGWCVVRRTNTTLPGKPIIDHAVARCADLGSIGADWEPLERDLTFAAASAVRDGLAAANPPEVWCVLRRRVSIVPEQQSLEFAAVRCDHLAGAFAGWEVVAENLTFAAAMAARAAAAAANAPEVWCVVRRPFSPTPDRQAFAFAVVRCDHVGAIGAWELVERNLDFAAASALRDASNAAETPAVWCLIRRTVAFGTFSMADFAIVRCDEPIPVADGWEIIERNLTFAAAAALRAAASAADPPTVFCVIRRFVALPTGRSVPQFSTVRCDDFGQLVGGLGWELVAGPLPFPVATATGAALQLAATAANPTPAVPPPPAPRPAGSAAPGAAAGAPDPGCSERFPRRGFFDACLLQSAYDELIRQVGVPAGTPLTPELYRQVQQRMQQQRR